MGPAPRRLSAGPPGAEGALEVGTRPLRRDAEVNRQHIVEAAGRLMAERGLATPLEDIAAAAGVGIATLYRRFPTRGELVDAVFRDRVAAYVADLEAAVGMPDGWEALVWLIRRSVARQIEDRALGELIEHDLGPDTIRQLRERLLPLAERLVAHARASGRLRPDFTVSDLALVQHMLASAGATTRGVRDEAWQRYLGFLLDGMVSARSRTTPLEEPALTIEELRGLRHGPDDGPGRQRPPATGGAAPA